MKKQLTQRKSDSRCSSNFHNLFGSSSLFRLFRICMTFWLLIMFRMFSMFADCSNFQHFLSHLCQICKQLWYLYEQQSAVELRTVKIHKKNCSFVRAELSGALLVVTLAPTLFTWLFGQGVVSGAY